VAKEKFEKAGGYSAPDKCCHIVGNAARWVMEILLDKGAIEGAKGKVRESILPG